MEEGKQADFSFRQTQIDILLHSQPTQAVSSFHGVILLWNSALCTQQRRQMLLYLLTAKEGRREGGREGERKRELCAFSASPSLQLCALARCKVTLSSYMYRLKDYKTERKWMVLFSLLLYMELLSVFPGCSLCRLTNNRSEETERLFTCQPQSSGCVVSPAAVDDTLTTLAALELHSYAVTGEAGPRAWTKVLAGKWRSNQYQKASFASVRLCNV